LTEAHVRLGDRSGVIPLLKEIVEKYPDIALPYLELGDAYEALGERDQFIALIVSALIEYPYRRMLYVVLLDTYKKGKGIRAAESALIEVVRRHPGSAAELQDIYEKLGEIDSFVALL